MLASLARRCRLSNVLVNAAMTPNGLRFASAHTTPSKTDGEIKLSEILKKRFPSARLLNVKDTSCKYAVSFARQTVLRYTRPAWTTTITRY